MTFGRLNAEAREAIHNASMRILARTGIRVDRPGVVDALVKRGATVGAEPDIVRFPDGVVADLVGTCPSEVRLAGEGGDVQTLNVDGGCCYWPGNALYLVEGDECRPMGTVDFTRLTRLVDRLPNVHAMVGIAVSDCPPALRNFATLRLMAQHTGKHLRPVIASSHGIEAVMEMARVLDDGGAEAAHRVSFGYSVVSPLHWTETALTLIEKTSGAGFPFMLNAEPMAGGTSPVTLAGSIAQANAETLSGIAIAQALEPGRPCFYNGGFAHALDMKSTVALCGSPEVYLMGAASADMARHYNLPCASWVSTEAMTSDAQASLEKMMGFSLHAARGVNLIWGMGQLESQMSISAEQLAIDDEIVGQVERLREGVAVDADHLAEEVLEEVGLGGNFLSHPHTMTWFRSELSEVNLGNRGRREAWDERGSKDMTQVARERVEALLDLEWEPKLDEGKTAELERIDSFWRERLRG